MKVSHSLQIYSKANLKINSQSSNLQFLASGVKQYINTDECVDNYNKGDC